MHLHTWDLLLERNRARAYFLYYIRSLYSVFFYCRSLALCVVVGYTVIAAVSVYFLPAGLVDRIFFDCSDAPATNPGPCLNVLFA